MEASTVVRGIGVEKKPSLLLSYRILILLSARGSRAVVSGDGVKVDWNLAKAVHSCGCECAFVCTCVEMHFLVH